MKKLLIFLFFAFIISACSEQGENINDNSLVKQEGIVAHKIELDNRNYQVLLIPNIKKEDLDNKTINQIGTMAREKDGAYYYVKSDEFKELKVGTQVMIYSDGFQEDSDPPQRVAEKIEVISE